MVEKTDAAEKAKPFDWREIEDDDELSFGSDDESESEGNAAADVSAPRSGDAEVPAPSKPGTEHAKGGDVNLVESTNPSGSHERVPASAHGGSKVNVSNHPANSGRKAPRAPVKWSPPLSKANDNGKEGQQLGRGVRAKPSVQRGNGDSAGVNKKAFMYARPHLRPSWIQRPAFPAQQAVMSGMRGLTLPPARSAVERGQFMKKRAPDGPRPHGDGMSSALTQLKTNSGHAASVQPIQMNPAAQPFMPRPPPQPSRSVYRPPMQLTQPTSQIQPRPHQKALAQEQAARPVPCGFERPPMSKPVALASTWIRGVSESVGAETRAAPADSRPAKKPTTSSTWVNPEIAGVPASGTAAGAKPLHDSTAPTPASLRHASSGAAIASTSLVPDIAQQAVEAAAAEELRKKDEMIAQLQAQLDKQTATKRRHDDDVGDHAIVPELSPKKVMRAAEGVRTSRSASRTTVGNERRRVEEGSRPKGDIISRVQFSSRNRDDKFSKDNASLPNGTMSMPPMHRTETKNDQRKDHADKDEGRYVARRGPERGSFSGRNGDSRRTKQDLSGRVERRGEWTEAEKLRMQRFGSSNVV